MAIQGVQDLGGLGRLAQTILQNRALDQQAIDKERAFGLQEAAGQRATSAAELNRQVQEGQLAESARLAQERTDQDFLQRGLTGLLGQPLAPGTGGLPEQQRIQQAAQFTSAVPGGTLADLASFGKIVDPTFAQGPQKVQRGQGAIVTRDGEQFFATPITDPSTGATRVELSPVGGTLASRQGETPEELSARKVQEEEDKAQAKADVELETAPDIKEAVTRAELEAKIDLEPDLEKKKTLQRDAAQAAEKNIVQLAKTEQNIRNYNNAIKAVQGGATTGTIARLFPSFRESSILLDQMQAELGLDVVGSVTFGALSKGELDLAKEVALPTNLEGPELIAWIEKKRDVQVKMASILREASIFLSQEGTTRADWLQKNGAATLPVESSPAQAAPTGKTATNPDTGAQVQELSDGSWVPVQ